MVEVVVLRRRGVVAPVRQAPIDPPILLSDLLGRLARVEELARTLRGVSRTQPDAFAEDKSDLVRALGRLKADVRRRGVTPL